MPLRAADPGVISTEFGVVTAGLQQRSRRCTMREQPLHPGHILSGALFNEPMRVETVRAHGPDVWDVGLVGVHSDRFRRVTLTAQDLEALTLQTTLPTYAGDGHLLRLGLQAYALGIAHENGLIADESVQAPDPAALKRAVAAISAKFPPEDVALYLSTLTWQDAEAWSGLADLPETTLAGKA